MGNPNIPRLDPGGTRFGTASTGGPTPGHKCLGRFKVCGSGVGSGLLRMIEDYFPIPNFFLSRDPTLRWIMLDHMESANFFS